MEDFADAILQYQENLIANRYPAEKPAIVKQLHLDLVQERKERNAASSDRYKTTDLRIIRLNRVWDMMVMIADATGYIFEEDPTAREIFSLPRNVSASNTEEL